LRAFCETVNLSQIADEGKQHKAKVKRQKAKVKKSREKTVAKRKITRILKKLKMFGNNFKFSVSNKTVRGKRG